MAKDKNIGDAMGDLLGLENKSPQKTPAGEGSDPYKWKRHNIYMDDELWSRLKIYAYTNKTSSSNIISSLVENFLKDKS